MERENGDNSTDEITPKMAAAMSRNCARDQLEEMILAGLNEAARFPTIRSEIDRYIMEDILRAALSGVEWTTETVEFIGNLKHENKHIREP